jgi:hypothetical protein
VVHPNRFKNRRERDALRQSRAVQVAQLIKVAADVLA